MRPSRLALFVAAAATGLAACSAPPAATGSTSSTTSGAYVPDGAPEYGPGDYCAETYVLIQETTRSNFSLGSEYYRNDDFCAAYPYISWMLENDPLFTGEEPDDRNYLRMATIYEDFAAQVDSTNEAERKAYLDSALASRRAGVEAMEEAGVSFDPYLRDLREGFFFFQNSAYYPDAEEQQFDAFTRAFEAKPDSLEDWYIVQLINASALRFGNEVPNPDRAEYIRNVSQYLDDSSLSSGYEQFAASIEREQAGTVNVGDDAAVEALIASFRSGSISDSDALTLLAVILQQPDRIENLGEDIDALRSGVIRLPAIQNQVDNPRTLVALAFQEFRDGNSARGNELFNRAIENAESNLQRADFYYARANAGYGNASSLINDALRVYPSHGPSLYRRASLIAQSVGRPSSLTGRFAYWCLADEYRSVAARTSDSRIASLARTAAARYERSGPTREQYFLAGYQPGQTVSASLGAYGSCSTRVR